MSARARLFAILAPRIFRAAGIRLLARIAADAFGSPPPQRSTLDNFASFTAEHAATATRESAERLFSSACALGSRLRAWLGVRTMAEAADVARALYRMIGVDFRVEGAGGFVVESCFFSSRYTPGTCRLISSLDAGLLAGLTGGERMVFTQRITEGAAVCRGELR